MKIINSFKKMEECKMRMMVKNIETRGIMDVSHLLNKELDIYLRSYNCNHDDIRLVMSKETYNDLIYKGIDRYLVYRIPNDIEIFCTKVEFNNDKPFGMVTIWPCHSLVSANGYFDTDITFNYGGYFKELKMEEFKMPEIKNVIFNAPATIVFWSDGTKTIVKAQDNEYYDAEKGLAMAISKKALGNKGNYNDIFKKHIGDYFGTCMNKPEV